MNRKTIHQPLETFVILPYNDYKLLCQKIEKAESGEREPESASLPQSKDFNEETVMDESSEQKDKESVKPDVKKDLTSHYRSSHIKKMIKHIEKLLGLENLDALIRTALNQSRKKVPREEEFFNFLFSNGLGQYVKNRSKIELYSPEKDSWYHI